MAAVRRPEDRTGPVRHAPVIVKIGGSLAGAPHNLRALLHETLPRAAQAQQTIIVPGGGPFADAVRAAQRHFGCDDATAHDMALLAMAQYGLLLGTLGPLQRAAGLDALRTGAGSATRIWLPDPQRDALAVPRSWRITADYLALWLARELGARHVILVKSCAPAPSDDLAALARAGVIDAAYPELAADLPRVATTLVFEGSAGALRSALAAAT